MSKTRRNTKRQQAGSQFTITAKCTVTDPAERARRLAQAYDVILNHRPMTSTTKQAILYARSANNEGASLIRQLEACRIWAEANGYCVAGEFSEAASGLSASLPQLAEAVRRAEVQGAALVCVGPSRLARSAVLYAQRVADCERRGVAVLFAEEGVQQNG